MVFPYVHEYNMGICCLTHLAWKSAWFIPEQSILSHLTPWRFWFALVQTSRYMNICMSFLYYVAVCIFKNRFDIWKNYLWGKFTTKLGFSPSLYCNSDNE